jgi:hypothetical protein
VRAAVRAVPATAAARPAAAIVIFQAPALRIGAW